MAKLGISQHLRIQYTEIWGNYLKEIKMDCQALTVEGSLPAATSR